MQIDKIRQYSLLRNINDMVPLSGLTTQYVLVHPIEERRVLCTAHNGWSRFGSFVGHIWHTKHFHGASIGLEHCVELFPLLQATIIVNLTLYEQGRRFAPVGVGNRRTAPVHIRDFMRPPTHLSHPRPRPILRCAVQTYKVGDWILSNGCFEAIGLSYDPTSQIPSKGETAASQAIRVSDTTSNNIVHSSHRILVVEVAPVTVDPGAKLGSIPHRSAEIYD